MTTIIRRAAGSEGLANGEQGSAVHRASEPIDGSPLAATGSHQPDGGRAARLGCFSRLAGREVVPLFLEPLDNLLRRFAMTALATDTRG